MIVLENIKVKLRLPEPNILLQYGTVKEDHSFGIDNHIRVMNIRYMGVLYRVRTEYGNVMSLKQWDNFAYQEDKADICRMEDKELASMMMLADRDRKNNPDAERVYWLCIEEADWRWRERNEE